MATEIEFFNKELTLVDFDGGSYIVCAECNERRRMHEDTKRNLSRHARSKTFFWQQDNWEFDDTKWLQTSRKVYLHDANKGFQFFPQSECIALTFLYYLQGSAGVF